MEFNHRSYSGKIFRPKPEVFFSPQDKFVIIATPWGSRKAAKECIEVVSGFMTANIRDPDATSPYQKLPNLSKTANALRVSSLLANEFIFKNVNKQEYKNGVEFLIAACDKQDLTWVQVGQPHMLLCRAQRPILPISIDVDLSMDLSDTSSSFLPPMPANYFGADETPYFSLNNLKIKANDRLLFVSRSWLPAKLYECKESAWNIDAFTDSLSQSEPDQPFWVGMWSFGA